MIIKPIDKHDEEAAKMALYLPFDKISSPVFSDKAKKVIRYFDGTAFLFIYKGQLVLTDESLYLTDAGDGTMESPIGFPRWTGSSVNELNEWFETVYSELVEFEDEYFLKIIEE